MLVPHLLFCTHEHNSPSQYKLHDPRCFIVIHTHVDTYTHTHTHTQQHSMRQYHAEMPSSAINAIVAWHAYRQNDTSQSLVRELHGKSESKQQPNGLHDTVHSVAEGSETKSLRQVLEGNQRRCAIYVCNLDTYVSVSLFGCLNCVCVP